MDFETPFMLTVGSHRFENPTRFGRHIVGHEWSNRLRGGTLPIKKEDLQYSRKGLSKERKWKLFWLDRFSGLGNQSSELPLYMRDCCIHAFLFLRYPGIISVDVHAHFALPPCRQNP